MTVFSPADIDRLDWELLRDGASTLYYRKEILEQHVAWLVANGYRVESFDSTELSKFAKRMSEVLRFRENYGYDEWTGNLDALNDAIGDLEFGDQRGFAFCFLQYDALQKERPEVAQGILDLIEWHSRDNLLFGRRLLALVQTDNPRIQFAPVGSRHVLWNRQEWSDRDRGM